MSPTEAGEELARDLLKATRPLRGVVIDLRDRPPAMLISGFFQAFLLYIHEHAPEQLEDARQIQWAVTHDFQRRNIERWVSDFTPFTNG